MGLRIGIDVGGTFTHGVVLEPPGSVIATARTPTTLTDQRGVAAGIATVLRMLLDELARLGRDKAEVELVAHSTTQATNALLEGDLRGVQLAAIAPPGERGLVSRALRQRKLDIGGGHSIALRTEVLDWTTVGAGHAPPAVGTRPAASVPGDMAGSTGAAHTADAAGGAPTQDPIAVIQPLAGKHENREQALTEQYRAAGHPTVAASEITQVLGLAARARTAVVNAAMLPTMLATAEYTETVVNELLPGVPLQVVRSDGGAMTIAEMRRQPIQSLLSGPAAGASAALHRSGLSDAVFIEVGGTSTDITLIKDGRVRHRYATVGGQRLMVPALDLRTVAVGGGSMHQSYNDVFGPRSAHIAGMPYLFQSLASGRTFYEFEKTPGQPKSENYVRVPLDDNTYAAFTLTDYWLSTLSETELDTALFELGVRPSEHILHQILRLRDDNEVGQIWHGIEHAHQATIQIVDQAITELAKEHNADREHSCLVCGGGGGPVLLQAMAKRLGMHGNLIPDHAVISAIGAALAVTCVSLSRHCAQPTSGDIAELIDQVEARLAAQGAERVQTDYEFDPRRQVLTVTGRGSRPYEQDATVHSEAQLADITREVMKADPALAWHDEGTWLWIDTVETSATRQRVAQPSLAVKDSVSAGAVSPTQNLTQPRRAVPPHPAKHRSMCATDRFGRVLWLGRPVALESAAAGRIGDALDAVVARHTQHTDGGAVLPHLGLLTGGRYIPLDQLGSAELIAEVLRWEKLPADAEGCFVVGKAS